MTSVDPPFATALDVPVAGGRLAVALAGRAGGPVVLAAHGITASHRAWVVVADRLGPDVACLAPDLRGRGQSASLPGPYGIGAHVEDLVAVLDHIGAVNATLVGHSMGAYVAARLAATRPERVSALVLVDGGLPLPAPAGADPDEVLAATLGPALARLSQTFASRQEHRDFWRAHPAFAGDAWTPAVEAYVDADLTGTEPELRSRVSPEAVRADGRDLLVDAGVRHAVLSVSCPTVLLRAPRGLLDQPDPLLPDDVVADHVAQVPGLIEEVVPDTNHYRIVLCDREAAVVAARIRTAAGL
ncbi:hypothetical protein BH20ACT2_BH20ACT2_16970 [soil metagenome]